MVLKLSHANNTDQQKHNPIDLIKRFLLSEDFERYEMLLQAALAPQAEYLTETEFALYKSGKQIRPVMMLLSARMLNGPNKPLPEKVIKGAISLEMLHIATLIHDDIVDDALVRRGMKSVNAARGSKTAIIVGDLQFVQAIRSFVDAIDTDRDMNLVKLVLDTAYDICRGELDEIQTQRSWSLMKLREQYFLTIERKTAVLFGLSCEAGVSLAGGHTGDARRAGFYGRRVGRAFQIMDDLFDFVHSDMQAGKVRGMDLSRRCFSLPIIYAMSELGESHKVTRIMRGETYSNKELSRCIDEITQTLSFDKTHAEARTEILDALEYLGCFPKNRYRDALEELAMYVVDRGF